MAPNSYCNCCLIIQVRGEGACNEASSTVYPGGHRFLLSSRIGLTYPIKRLVLFGKLFMNQFVGTQNGLFFGLDDV